MWHNRPVKAVASGEPTYKNGGQQFKKETNHYAMGRTNQGLT
jgi:hypothetical protein